MCPPFGPRPPQQTHVSLSLVGGSIVQRSTDHILTTHTGSLPRPADLDQMLFDREEGKPVDPAQFAERVRSAVNEVMDKQLESGVDVVNDGEVSKIGYSTYVKDRLT